MAILEQPSKANLSLATGGNLDEGALAAALAPEPEQTGQPEDPWAVFNNLPGLADVMKRRGIKPLQLGSPDAPEPTEGAVRIFSSTDQLAKRMKDHPEEFGSSFVPRPGMAVAEGISPDSALGVEEEDSILGLS